MSISTADTEAEQTVRPTNCSQTGRRGSDTRVPPNTEEDEDIICPWMDCLLKGESDESSSSEIQNYNKDPPYNEHMDFNSDREPTSDDSSWENYEVCSDDFKIISKEGALAVPRPEFETQITDVTICRKENSSVDSGTDGGNSDIGDLVDFSADEEESQVEQFSGCRTPGCQCEGRIEYMEWDSDDMTDTDDSEWEDPDERENRLWVERYNFDLIEGMTLMTYTPPPQNNRRRRDEDRVKYGPEIQESTSRTSELGFQTDEESPNSEPAVQPGTVADEDIPSVMNVHICSTDRQPPPPPLHSRVPVSILTTQERIVDQIERTIHSTPEEDETLAALRPYPGDSELRLTTTRVLGSSTITDPTVPVWKVVAAPPGWGAVI